jgi:hypothetical protein
MVDAFFERIDLEMRIRLCVLLFFVAASCSPRPDTITNPTKADMVGTWLVNPNSFNIGQMPRDFRSFALKLNDDGDFQALHVPGHFFFLQWPAHEQLHGKWRFEYDSRDDMYYLFLDFAPVDGEGGGWNTVLYWRDRNETWNSSRDLFLRINIGESAAAMQFGLSKRL